jgi:hypothetical protein
VKAGLAHVLHEFGLQRGHGIGTHHSEITAPVAQARKGLKEQLAILGVGLGSGEHEIRTADAVALAEQIHRFRALDAEVAAAIGVDDAVFADLGIKAAQVATG